MSADGPIFATVRDLSASFGRAVLSLDVSVFDQAIEEAERALSVGPVFDPTLFQIGVRPLQEQLELVRATREYRAAVERIATQARAGL